MSRSYFTLLSRANASERWAIEFGDYNRSVVLQEKEDIAVFGAEYKIIKTDEEQAAIDAAVAKLNNKEDA